MKGDCVEDGYVEGGPVQGGYVEAAPRLIVLEVILWLVTEWVVKRIGE